MRRHELRQHVPIVLFALLCAVIAGTALLFSATLPKQPPILALDNVEGASVVEIRSHDGALALAGEFRSRRDALGNMEKDASFTDRTGRRVIGEVELEVPAANRPDRRPELEVDIMGLAPQTSFTVFIDDKPVATFITDDRGSVDMEVQEGEAPTR